MKPPFDISGDLDTPVSAFLKLQPFRPSFLLESVEGGEMTKDLSILISKDQPWLTTEDFLDALDRRLQAKMG